MAESGRARCLYCRLAEVDPQSFCLSYQPGARADAETCEAFRPSAEPPLRCLAFRRGERRPFIHDQDVTGGYATAFGDGVPGALRDVLGVLGRYFAFDFEACPDPIFDRGFEGREGRSVVYQSLLARRST